MTSPNASGAEPAGSRASRLATTVALAVVVLLGLAVTRLGSGPVADATGDALYAATAVLAVRWLLPARSWRWHTGIGLGWCVLVELAQLTGVPAAIGQAVPPVRLVLGTTFVATDLLWYAVGALGCAVLIVLCSRCWLVVRTRWVRRRAGVEPAG